MEHHQIAVLALQFFFVGFDLHLPWHWPLLFHRLLLLLGFRFTACSKVSQPFLLRSPASIPALLDSARPGNNLPESY
jgi:hypothetical protein